MGYPVFSYNGVMGLFGVDISGGLELARRVNDKYWPVFDAASDKTQAALAWYFLPHRSRKEILGVTRPRVLKWYCPFADQRQFPSGHRYCINVYTGCEHECAYCYAANYEPDQAGCKKNFERKLRRDLDDLETYDVPPAPVHLSNSTDPFQPLETHVGQTRFALQQIVGSRHRFTSVVLLTKNPAIAAQGDYIELLKQLAELPEDHRCRKTFQKRNLPGLRVEVSLAFWRDEARACFDPGAPSVTERMKAIRALRAAGVAVVLRIDPLFPQPPLANGKTMADFDLPEAQTEDDLKRLVAFAAEIGAMHIVYSVAKITRPRSRPMSKTMQNLKRLYEHLAGPAGLVFRGGSWRLPTEIARRGIVEPLLSSCRNHNITAMFCKQNLISTP